MQIVISIPDEQVKKSLEESKNINEDEGVKGSVHIVMLYTNARLEFVDVERKTDFYSCEYKILPKEHGDLISRDFMKEMGATCIAKRNETGELVAISSIDILPKYEAESEDKE